MLGRFLHKFNQLRRWYERHQSYDRAFDPAAPVRLLLVTIPERIPGSQVFPFHYYRKALRSRFGVEISELTFEHFLYGDHDVRGATVVAFQTPEEVDEAMRDRIMARITEVAPTARRIYLDWFAPTDLRYAALLGPHVDLYVKKHVLRDRSLYAQETYGDTTLMEFYGRRAGLDLETRRFAIPEGFLDKLLIGPSFLTADFLLPKLKRAEIPSGERPIDLHARVAVTGDPWYQAMRGDAQAPVDRLARESGLNIVTGTGIRHDQFLAELRRSKVCYSPFGYGEVCWRDFEAIQNGAVLLKEDMSHVETAPDIFLPDETYVPVRWDHADLAVKLDRLLADEERRAEIAENALGVLVDYARERRFLDQMAPIFEPPAA